MLGFTETLNHSSAQSVTPGDMPIHLVLFYLKLVKVQKVEALTINNMLNKPHQNKRGVRLARCGKKTTKKNATPRRNPKPHLQRRLEMLQTNPGDWPGSTSLVQTGGFEINVQTSHP